MMGLSTNHLAGIVESLEMSRISPPKTPLRGAIEQVDELMRSIEDKGLLHPIIVRPDGGKFEVVAGHRRYIACKMLRWARVPVQIVDIDDKEAFELSLTENVQHETLSPMESALAFKRYTSDAGYGGITELARKIGKSEQYVSQYLQLLKLPSSVAAKVSTRVVSLAQARELFALRPQQQKTVARLIEAEKLTSRQVKSVAATLKKTGYEGAFFDSKPYSAQERKLEEADRIMGKCLASLKVCLLRFDECIDQVDEDEFILKESLVSHRMSLNHQIDNLIRLRKRVKQALI